MKRTAFIFVALLGTLCLNAQETSKANRWPSFLNKTDFADATKFIPAPPDTSSIAYLNDFNRYQWGKSMRNTARGKQAIYDASVDIDSVLNGFSEAFGMPISKQATPELHYLMERVENDGSLSVRSAKKKYMRKRKNCAIQALFPLVIRLAAGQWPWFWPRLTPKDKPRYLCVATNMAKVG